LLIKAAKENGFTMRTDMLSLYPQQGGGVGAKTGLYRINGKIRKLSPRECARISGFPDSFILHPKESESYKQFGNTVVVDVIQHILLEIIKIGIFESVETQNKPIKKIPIVSNLI